jgi:hypothetical protein
MERDTRRAEGMPGVEFRGTGQGKQHLLLCRAGGRASRCGRGLGGAGVRGCRRARCGGRAGSAVRCGAGRRPRGAGRAGAAVRCGAARRRGESSTHRASGRRLSPGPLRGRSNRQRWPQPPAPASRSPRQQRQSRLRNRSAPIGGRLTTRPHLCRELGSMWPAAPRSPPRHPWSELDPAYATYPLRLRHRPPPLVLPAPHRGHARSARQPTSAART